MSIQANNLNPLLIKDPKSLYNYNVTKTRILKIASIINIICIIIFSFYLFSFLGASTAVLPLTNFLMSATIPFLGVSFKILNDFSRDSSKVADFYKKILFELKFLKANGEVKIKKYLNQIKCSNISNINQILFALVQFKVLSAKKEASLNEIYKIKQIKSNDKNFNYIMLQIAHDIYEKEVLNIKIKLAQLYHIMNNPTDKLMICNYGKIFTMPFAKRIDSIMQGNDCYFVFNDKIQKERQKKGLSFIEIDRLNIQDISKLIYQN